MNARSIRRAAERKAAKLTRKQAGHATLSPATANTIAEAHTTAHRAAPIPSRSTGPRTPGGKAVSCLNHTKHGLTGQFRLIANESEELFHELRDALRDEHQPQTATERILVDRLAEHVWLVQRAQRYQNEAAGTGDQSWFALMLRYETTHDRAFHKCLAELRTMRRERAQLARDDRQQPLHPADVPAEFESQKPATAAVTASSAHHHQPPQFESQASPNRAPDTPLSPAPGIAAVAPTGNQSLRN